MATIHVLDSSVPYYHVRAVFQEHEFEQLLISYLIGAELLDFLQDYADDYEAAWLALPPQEVYPE